MNLLLICRLESHAEPLFACRYWQVFQRLVLLGWVDDARDLLFSHSELHAPEEQLSRSDKVKHASAALALCLPVPCCAVPCCAVPCCPVLYCAVLYCTALYCTVLYNGFIGHLHSAECGGYDLHHRCEPSDLSAPETSGSQKDAPLLSRRIPTI